MTDRYVKAWALGLAAFALAVYVGYIAWNLLGIGG